MNRRDELEEEYERIVRSSYPYDLSEFDDEVRRELLALFALHIAQARIRKRRAER